MRVWQWFQPIHRRVVAEFSESLPCLRIIHTEWFDGSGSQQRYHSHLVSYSFPALTLHSDAKDTWSRLPQNYTCLIGEKIGEHQRIIPKREHRRALSSSTFLHGGVWQTSSEALIACLPNSSSLYAIVVIHPPTLLHPSFLSLSRSPLLGMRINPWNRFLSRQLLVFCLLVHPGAAAG
jgi:hypothetical protein